MFSADADVHAFTPHEGPPPDRVWPRATPDTSRKRCPQCWRPPATAPRSPAVICSERSKMRPSSMVASAPRPTPQAPPKVASTTASMRICSMTSPRRAPTRFADADFARALRDAHQHDVHDDDAAHHQRDAGDRHHHRGHHAEQLVDEAADGVGREGVEIVLLAGTRMEAGAQRDARFIERAVQSKAARRAWGGRRARNRCRDRTGG